MAVLLIRRVFRGGLYGFRVDFNQLESAAHRVRILRGSGRSKLCCSSSLYTAAVSFQDRHKAQEQENRDGDVNADWGGEKDKAAASELGLVVQTHGGRMLVLPCTSRDTSDASHVLCSQRTSKARAQQQVVVGDVVTFLPLPLSGGGSEGRREGVVTSCAPRRCVYARCGMARRS